MKADVLPLSLPGVMLIRSTRISDSRGSFAETYVRGDFAKSGIPNDFVQDKWGVTADHGSIPWSNRRRVPNQWGRKQLPEAARLACRAEHEKRPRATSVI